MEKDGVWPRILLSKKQVESFNWYDLNNDVRRWLINLKNDEVLKKFTPNTISFEKTGVQ